MRIAKPASLAAIVHPDRLDGADGLLADFCQSLQSQGWRVGGVVQIHRLRPSGGKWMLLRDVRTGEKFSISQDLGPHSQSCCIDPSGVAQASGALRQALADRVDLTLVNRFGALEAAGGGFASELLALLVEERPLLTMVSEKHVQAWRDFTGGMGEELPPHLPALRSWFTLAVDTQRSQTDNVSKEKVRC